VLFVGRAQEKNVVFHTEKRRNPVTGATYPWLMRSTGVINKFYCYCVDGDFGPFFLKFCSYFPYNAKLCINATSAPSAKPPGPASGSSTGQRLRRGG
jgi:hypothetical protein